MNRGGIQVAQIAESSGFLQEGVGEYIVTVRFFRELSTGAFHFYLHRIQSF